MDGGGSCRVVLHRALDFDCRGISRRTFIRRTGGGDCVALAMTSAKRQMWIAMLIAAINVPGTVTIDAIVIYLILDNLATIPYSKWCKKQLVAQAKP